MNILQHKPEKWGLIFILLSMDVIAEFYQEMGVGFLDPKRFIPLLRGIIIENRKLYTENPAQIPPIAERVTSETKAFLGHEIGEKMLRWSLLTFMQVHQDQPQWSAWQIAFNEWAYDRTLTKPMGLSTSKRAELMERYRQAVRLDDVRRKVVSLREQLLSDWDLEMYAIHRFSEDVIDPLDVIIATTKIHRFQVFWPTITTLLNDGEQQSLWAHGRQLLQGMGIHMPEPLKSPSAMEELRP